MHNELTCVRRRCRYASQPAIASSRHWTTVDTQELVDI